MNKVREIKINSTLWATPSKIVNLLDFKPEKLSIETRSNSNNDIKVHHVTRFTNNVIPEENTRYTCISAIDIDSVLKIDKKSLPQAYLEQCKYKLKKKNTQDILIILKLLIMIVKLIVIAIVLVMLKLKVKKKLKILNYLDNHQDHL